MSFLNRSWFWIVWNSLFRTKKLKQSVNSEMIQEINKSIDRRVDKLEADFTEKIRYIQYEKDYKLYKGGAQKVIELYTVPILTRRQAVDSMATAYCDTRDIGKISVDPMMLAGYPASDMKSEAAREIADKIVEMGFVKSHVEGNNVLFYLDYVDTP